jgi:DNA mismatch endonuclease (patch repair protein)
LDIGLDFLVSSPVKLARSKSHEIMLRKRSADIPVPSSEAAKKRMESVGRRDTAAENAIRSILFRMGVRYRVDVAPLEGVRRRVDILFPRARIAVYVDGCFWHGCPIHATWPKANADFWRNKIETNQRRLVA